MDLNYLLTRQQEERIRASAASCTESRHAHEGLAKGYEDRIRRLTEGRIDIDPRAGAA